MRKQLTAPDMPAAAGAPKRPGVVVGGDEEERKTAAKQRSTLANSGERVVRTRGQSGALRQCQGSH